MSQKPLCCMMKISTVPFGAETRGNMKKKISLFLAAALLILSLAGCGENQIPYMTDEQMQMLGEFTAITLMKYDANRRSRLVDLSLLEQARASESPALPQTDSASQGMEPVDDVPVVDVSQDPQEPQETQEPAGLEQALGLPQGITVLFMGQEAYDSYPADEGAFFAVTAAEGKKLLVLDFAVINALEQEQTVDFLTLSPSFRVTVNGEYARRALTTMLENDMSTYAGSVPAMGSVSLVLVIEVDEAMAGSVQSLTLDMKSASGKYSVSLM